MNQLPRIALGTVQRDDDLQCILWALLNVLDRSGLQVQSFSSQSRCDSRDAALAITGQGKRHLDSWLMDPDICSELFSHGNRCADIGVVDGQFDGVCNRWFTGGSLDTLCEWLDLPPIAVLNVERLEQCRFPSMPVGLAGILLDNVKGIGELCHLQTMLEALYGVPVLGALPRKSRLRTAVANLPFDGKPTAELCNALGDALVPHLQFEKLLELAARRALPLAECELFREPAVAAPINIAIAHDEAFSCYFPDTFDVLESQGASVNVFSPLRSESLPSGTDVVYLGCGHLERHLNELSANVCMKDSLWSHIVSGGRVYAESAGLAYLCREIVMPSGERWPMVGLLPTLARRQPHPAPDRAIEINTARGSWLFPSNDRVRGYLDSKWIIQPNGCFCSLVSEAEHSHDLVGDYQIFGSRMHLNFAARPDCVERFFQPCRRVRLNTVS